MTFQSKYRIINERVAELFGMPFNVEHSTLDEHEITNIIIKYVYEHAGMTGNTFNHDKILWRELDVNMNMTITTASVWGYMSKYLEEI